MTSRSNFISQLEKSRNRPLFVNTNYAFGHLRIGISLFPERLANIRNKRSLNFLSLFCIQSLSIDFGCMLNKLIFIEPVICG